MKTKIKAYRIIVASNGAVVCDIQAERVKVNTRSDVYEFYIGKQVVAYVPKFQTIVKMGRA